MSPCLGMEDYPKVGVQMCAEKEGGSSGVQTKLASVGIRTINNVSIKVKLNPSTEDSRPQHLSMRINKRKAHEMESTTCEECGRSLPSQESKYDHMRCHAKTPHKRMINPYAKLSRWSVTARRGKTPSLPFYAYISADTLMEMTSLEGEQETIIGMDSNDTEDSDIEMDSKDAEDLEMTPKSPLSRMYGCRMCYKSFATYQALRGHCKASHGKRKNSEVKARIRVETSEADRGCAKDWVAYKAAATDHICNICGATFMSGKALGGHKRHHVRAPNQGTV